MYIRITYLKINSEDIILKIIELKETITLSNDNDARVLREEMKKTVYLSPEMEVIKLNAPVVLQAMSDGSGSTADPNNPISGDSDEEIII